MAAHRDSGSLYRTFDPASTSVAWFQGLCPWLPSSVPPARGGVFARGSRDFVPGYLPPCLRHRGEVRPGPISPSRGEPRSWSIRQVPLPADPGVPPGRKGLANRVSRDCVPGYLLRCLRHGKGLVGRGSCGNGSRRLRASSTCAGAGTLWVPRAPRGGHRASGTGGIGGRGSRGCARPGLADPWLPSAVPPAREGRNAQREAASPACGRDAHAFRAGAGMLAGRPRSQGWRRHACGTPALPGRGGCCRHAGGTPALPGAAAGPPAREDGLCRRGVATGVRCGWR